MIDTNYRSEAVVEVAEAMGFAIATIKAFMEPTGVTADMCHDAIERLESARASLAGINLAREV